MTIDVQNAAADTEITRRIAVPWPDLNLVTNPNYALVPSLTSSTPATGVHAGSGVAVTIVGDRFLPGAQIVVDGVPQATTYVSKTGLTGTVSMAGTTAGTVPLVVRNQNLIETEPVDFVIT